MSDIPSVITTKETGAVADTPDTNIALLLKTNDDDIKVEKLVSLSQIAEAIADFDTVITEEVPAVPEVVGVRASFTGTIKFKTAITAEQAVTVSAGRIIVRFEDIEVAGKWYQFDSIDAVEIKEGDTQITVDFQAVNVGAGYNFKHEDTLLEIYELSTDILDNVSEVTTDADVTNGVTPAEAKEKQDAVIENVYINPIREFFRDDVYSAPLYLVKCKSGTDISETLDKYAIWNVVTLDVDPETAVDMLGGHRGMVSYITDKIEKPVYTNSRLAYFYRDLAIALISAGKGLRDGYFSTWQQNNFSNYRFDGISRSDLEKLRGYRINAGHDKGENFYLGDSLISVESGDIKFIDQLFVDDYIRKDLTEKLTQNINGNNKLGYDEEGYNFLLAMMEGLFTDYGVRGILARKGDGYEYSVSAPPISEQTDEDRENRIFKFSYSYKSVGAIHSIEGKIIPIEV